MGPEVSFSLNPNRRAKNFEYLTVTWSFGGGGAPVLSIVAGGQESRRVEAVTDGGSCARCRRHPAKCRRYPPACSAGRIMASTVSLPLANLGKQNENGIETVTKG